MKPIIVAVMLVIAGLAILTGCKPVRINQTPVKIKVVPSPVTAVAPIVAVKTNMPPGFELQINRAGNYRAARSGPKRAVFTLDDPSTKEAAIFRAWQQYEFEQSKARETWEDVK